MENRSKIPALISKRNKRNKNKNTKRHVDKIGLIKWLKNNKISTSEPTESVLRTGEYDIWNEESK